MAMDKIEVAPSPDKNPPVVNIELKQAEVDAVGTLKPGDKVRVTLEGVVTDYSLREPYGDSDIDYVGSLRIESKRTKVVNTGPMDDLLDEDD